MDKRGGGVLWHPRPFTNWQTGVPKNLPEKGIVVHS